jgi:hypothetical protein
MAPKPGAATDTRPLKKVYLHPSGLQASVTQGVLERQRPILSELKQTMGQRLEAKWTCGKQARIYAKGEFIGCSGGTASVTVLERFSAESIDQGAVHLEAKRTAYSGWASTYSTKMFVGPVPVRTTVQPGRFSNFCRQKFAQLEAKNITSTSQYLYY